MNLLWRLSLKNLLRNKRRSLTTGIAITSGFVGLSLLGAYIFRVQNGLQANTIYINLQGHLQIRKLGSMENFSLTPKKYVIPPELDQAIEKTLAQYQENIEFKGKFLTGSGLLVAEGVTRPFLARGAEPEVSLKAVHHPTVSKWAKGWIKNAHTYTLENLARPEAISITPRMQEVIGIQKNIQLMTRSLQNDLNAVNAEVGMLHTTGIALSEDTSIRMPLKLLQELLATESYQYLSIFLFDAKNRFELKRKLIEDFKRQKLPLEVFLFTEGEIGEFYVGTMSFLYVMSAFFIILICSMVVLSIINSLTLGILERVKELGTLKAIGFSRNIVVGIFVRETIWLCGISIVSGVVVSQIISALVNRANIQFAPPGVEGQIQFQLAPDIRLYGILLVLILVIASMTSYLVSNIKLKESAISLLNDTGV